MYNRKSSGVTWSKVSSVNGVNTSSMSDISGIPGIVTNDLVLHVDVGDPDSYPGSGTTWSDLVGGFNGTLSNGPTYSSGNGGHILFDGSDDVSNHGNDSSLNFNSSSPLTIQLWLNSDRDTEYQILASRFHQTSLIGWEFSLGPSNNRDEAFFVFRNSQSEQKSAYSNSLAYVPDTWVNVAITYDGSENASNITFYGDGVDVGNTVLQNNTVNPAVSSTADLTLGARGTLSRLHGSLAAVKIYNRELSSAEILQNYNSTKSRYGY